MGHPESLGPVGACVVEVDSIDAALERRRPFFIGRGRNVCYVKTVLSQGVCLGSHTGGKNCHPKEVVGLRAIGLYERCVGMILRALQEDFVWPKEIVSLVDKVMSLNIPIGR